MKKIMKWTGITLGGLTALIALTGVVLYPIGLEKLNRSYPNIPIETIQIPSGPDAVTRGQHIATIWACTRCHGEDLSGTLMTNDPIEGGIPILGAIPASNLTSGRGGMARSFTDTDWVRAIRHGVKPDSRAEVFMYDYSTMSDQDLGDLIAYLKQIPPVDTESLMANYGPIMPIAPAVGMFVPAAELIDHSTPRPANPVRGATIEYGQYLSAICAGCHGKSVANKLKNWTQEDFIRTFHTGVLPNGKQLGPTMSSKAFSEMTDMELTALFLYYLDVKPE
jgi:mono/diheme cytochrome c family protein